MIKLSDRLKIVYDMIPSCASAADIGCDHGYLSIALVEGKKAKRVIAMDINKGPVEAAKEHVKLYGKEDFIEVRRSDGLDELKENEAQVIAICGMGGNLMRRIMEKHIDLCQRAEALVVEPQSEMEEFRSFLNEAGFAIEDEAACVEEHKFYPVIRVSYKPEEAAKQKLTKAQLKYGPVLLSKAPKELLEWLDKDEAEYKRIHMQLSQKLSGLTEAEGGAIRDRLMELSFEIDTIDAARFALGR